MNISKKDLIKNINDVMLDEETLKKLSDIVSRIKKNIDKPNNKDKLNNVDTTAPKYKLTLKFLNKILENNNKELITNIFDFKNIDRLDIIKEENKKLLEDMSKDLFKEFDKKKVGYYRKTDNIVLNVLRGLIKDLGYELIRKQTGRTIKSMHRTHYLYSIQ